MTAYEQCVALANTGLHNPEIFLFLALGLFISGALLAAFAKRRSGKVAALAITALAIMGTFGMNAQPAFAVDPNAPTSITAPTITATIDIPSMNLTMTQTAPASWSNPEGCGTLSYQWQIQQIGSVSRALGPWENAGGVTDSVAAGQVVSCNTVNDLTPEKARLIVTLTNSYGSAESVSSELTICPRG